MDKVLRNVLILSGLILVIAAGALIQAMAGKYSDNNEPKFEATGAATHDGQVVKVTVMGSKYIFSPSTVKSGTLVTLDVDTNSVKGCARSIVISEYGVLKYVTPQDNLIEFTPTKAGVLKIACSMNMYSGQITVT